MPWGVAGGSVSISDTASTHTDGGFSRLYGKVSNRICPLERRLM